MPTSNRLKVEEAKQRLRERLGERFESRRATATAVVTSVERDPVSGYTTGKVRATIDGVADQSVFIGAGTGVNVGESLRVENRAGGIGPEWVSLGKTGSVAGSEGNVDTGRPLSTPSGLGLASSVYSAANGATVLANITATWNQIGDWEGVAYYEIEYYLDSDGASKAHTSRAPHANGGTTASFTILNLLPGVSYSVRVRAVGYGGSLSSWTSYSSLATATDSSVPATPTGLGANQVSDTALRFYWSRSSEADFAYYEIGVSSTSGAGGLLSGYPLSTGDTPEHIVNVTPATNRYFRVRAVDTTGNASAWSSFSGPHATTETTSTYLDLAAIIDTDYGLGIQGSGKIGIDLASPSGLSFSSGDLVLADTVAGAGLGISSKVLAVNTDRLLSVVSDNVGITAGSTYQFIGTGSGTAAGWRNVSELAGAGLTAATGILAVGAGNGISVAADSVAVNQAYSFTWTGTHTFQTNDVQMDVNLDFVGAQSITTTSGNLTIAPAGDLLLTPGGADVLVTWGSGKSLTSSNYVSQTTGWGISYGTSGGHADFRSMYADELHVQAFTADVYQAMVGAIIITKSRGRLSRNFTVPATGLTGTLYLEDLEELADTAVFASGDNIRLRVVDSSGGGLVVTDVWGTVGSSTDLSGGEQSYTFTTTDDGGESGSVIFAGSVALDYGQTGGVTGVWEATVLDQAGAPYSQVKTWSTDPSNPANFTTHLRLGNLDGIAGIGLEYGLWAGQNTSDTYVLLSDSSFEAHGLRVSLYSSGTETIRLDPAVPSIALGETLPTAFGDGGIWMGRHSDGTYRLSIEEPDGYSYLRWTWDDDSSHYVLELAADLHLHNSPGAGGNDFGPTLTIDTYGLIAMGANGSIAMGADSSFSADAGSTFTIGAQGSGAYLGYAGGELVIEGKIIVTDGEDFLPNTYRPHSCDISVGVTPGVTGPEFLARSPYGDGGDYGIVGQLVTADQSQYWLKMEDDLDIFYESSRSLVFYVYKDHPLVGGIDNPTTYAGYSNVVLINAMNDNLWQALPDKTPYVIVGRGYLSSEMETLESFTGIGEGSMSIITPDYIQTPSLAVINPDMGAIIAGSIVVGTTNKLWLNDDATAPTVALAIGGSTKASAPFLVYEDGDFRAGGESANYIHWNGSTLTVKGDIRADAGYLGSLTVDGNLTMNGGQIRWNSNNSYIDDNKIVISEASGYSLTKIGDTTAPGLIDLTMFSGASGVWDFGIRIVDGGNSEAGISALYRGVSGVSGVAAVDRIFSAATATGSRSDGFHAEMAAYDSGGDFDAAGACFKGLHTDGGPVALLNQNGVTGPAPAVWVGSNKLGGKLLFMESGAATQTGIYLNNPNGYTDFVALNAGSGGVEYVRYQRFINLATSTAGAGDAGVPSASGTNEFIVYARQGALRMKNSLYEWTFSAGSPTSL